MKTALVTGGGRGIGRETSLLLAQRGYQVAVNYHQNAAAQGIRVNCVRPGFIYTEMHADGGEPGRVDRVASAIPMKRGGQPEEIAQAICWLLSDEASYITGSFIDAAGGR